MEPFTASAFVLALLSSALACRQARRGRPVAAHGTGAPIANGSGSENFLTESLVDYLAYSKVSACVLRTLAAQKKPLGFKALVEQIDRGQKPPPDHDPLPRGAIRAVLSLLQVARLARMHQADFAITPLGRDVYQRMVARRLGPIVAS